MTTITAKIVEDSVSPDGIRLTTMLLRYPRWIHAEGRTHRQLRLGEEMELPTPSLMEDPNLSRNASSSRAIPVSRLIQDVIDDPAVPLFWGKNQKGMQAGEEHDATVVFDTHKRDDYFADTREKAWLYARDQAIKVAQGFDKAGYHKQIVNRLLEPFSHINVVVTATEWSNFFALRRHKDAEPHIHLLADRMWEAMQASTPNVLRPGEWHLPFADDNDSLAQALHYLMNELQINPTEALIRDVMIKASVARCARTSYLTHEGKTPQLEGENGDLALYDKLMGGIPIHASPAEHQATPDGYNEPGVPGTGWEWPEQHGNLRGWRQYRKMLPNECQ